MAHFASTSKQNHEIVWLWMKKYNEEAKNMTMTTVIKKNKMLTFKVRFDELVNPSHTEVFGNLFRLEREETQEEIEDCVIASMARDNGKVLAFLTEKYNFQYSGEYLLVSIMKDRFNSFKIIYDERVKRDWDPHSRGNLIGSVLDTDLISVANFDRTKKFFEHIDIHHYRVFDFLNFSFTLYEEKPEITHFFIGLFKAYEAPGVSGQWSDYAVLVQIENLLFRGVPASVFAELHSIFKFQRSYIANTLWSIARQITECDEERVGLVRRRSIQDFNSLMSLEYDAGFFDAGESRLQISELVDVWFSRAMEDERFEEVIHLVTMAEYGNLDKAEIISILDGYIDNFEEMTGNAFAQRFVVGFKCDIQACIDELRRE